MVFCLVLAGIWARGLLTCLAGVIYCYSTYIHPRLLLIDQENIDLRTGSGDDAPIPKIIHQTWKDMDIPERWREAYDSCRQLHSDYKHMLWTDASAREFIAHDFPWFLPTYDAYPYVIQRADVIRYFVLLKFGGAYVDLDVGCRRRLDDLRHFGTVLPLTHPLGFSNEFMMASPGHPFMRRLVAELRLWARSFGTKYPTVMFSTGPMFVTAQKALYTAAHSHAAAAAARHRRALASGAGPESAGDEGGFLGESGQPVQAGEVWVLPDSFYGKFSNASEAYLRHYSGSSWHGGDAAFVKWLYHHLSLVITLGVGAALLVVADVVWWHQCRGRGGGKAPCSNGSFPSFLGSASCGRWFGSGGGNGNAGSPQGGRRLPSAGQFIKVAD